MKRIKILYMIDQLNIGGTEKQLLSVIERIDREKFEPYLVCLKNSEFIEKCEIDCHKKILNIKSLLSADGIIKLFRFIKYLKINKIDIVQTFFFDSTFFGVIAARFSGVKCILSGRRDLGFWYSPVILFVLFFINHLTNRVVVNSEAIKRNVELKERVKPDKIDVIYNGIDLDPFSLKYDLSKLRVKHNIPRKNKIVGIVANLNRHVKRGDVFVNAACQVLKTKKDVSFIVVGEGKYLDALKEQALGLGILNNICFVGSQENIVPYLQLFDIGVLTSDSEGFSNSILEYLAVGICAVSTDVGGSKEIIVDGLNGYLVPPDRPDCVAEKICILLDEDLEGKKASISETVNRFEWKVIIRQLETYYRKLLSNV